MHEHQLARDLYSSLEKLAHENHLTRVTRVAIDVGLLHGVEPGFLAHSFEHVFEGTIFQGAEVEIRLLDPGQDLPGTNQKATGRELIIRTLTGE